MNNDRRKQIDKIIADIEAQRETLDALKSELETIRGSIEEVIAEEQEAMENLPDSFRDGERGQAMEAAVSAMEEAMGDLENMISEMEPGTLDNIVTQLDTAKE